MPDLADLYRNPLSSDGIGCRSAGVSRSTSTRAEYCGRNIDGESYSATAYSYGTGQFYFVHLEFDGDEAIILFSSGGQISVTLDDEEIEDPDSISAFDYNKGAFWELDVDDLDS